MDSYMDAQISNMIVITKTFEQSCRITSAQSDGRIDKTTEKRLKRIHKITQRFIHQLEKLK